MKTASGVTRVVGAGLALVTCLTAGAAWGDVVCQGQGGSPVVKAFELSGDSNRLGWSKNAAVILNKGDGNVLLTGKVVTTPTRVGSHVNFTVVDAQGVESQLRYSSSAFDGSFAHCTRAGCDDLGGGDFAATLLHGGETYGLQCQNASP